MDDIVDEAFKTTSDVAAPKKPPRKPRPSEIAAKAAKAAAKKKPSKPKAKKPAAKKKTAKTKRPEVKKKSVKKSKRKAPKKTKAKVVRKPAKKTRAKKGHSRNVVRTERLDLRLTKKEKAAMHAKAKKMGRTITSIIIELIAKFK